MIESNDAPSELRIGLINRESESTLRNSTEPAAEGAPGEPKKERLKSIDIYRGLTMLGMILVDNQGSTPIWPLNESDWNGISTADLIFPSFLFVMGFAVPLAVRRPFKPLKTVLRVFGLFLIGFLLNITAKKYVFDNVRIFGVLQRISLCYIMVVGIHILTDYGAPYLRKYGVMIIAFLTATYISLMLCFEDGPDCNRLNNLTQHCNFTRWLDLKILTYDHMMKPTDPEGIFSTLSSLLTAYGGYYFCLIMKDLKMDRRALIRNWLALASFFLLTSGPVQFVMPYNKKLWTTSFALLTVGISGMMLIIMLLIVDVLGSRPNSRLSKFIDIVTRPCLWLGMNPLAIFVLMDLLAILMIFYFKSGDTSLWHAFYTTAFSSWIGNDYWATTVFSLFFAILWTLVAFIMFKLKIFIKL